MMDFILLLVIVTFILILRRMRFVAGIMCRILLILLFIALWGCLLGVDSFGLSGSYLDFFIMIVDLMAFSVIHFGKLALVRFSRFFRQI